MMKSLLLSSLVLLLLASIASASFSAAWKVEKLNELSKATPVVKYDSKSFDKFIDGPRNFSTIIVFTALGGSQNCEACRTLQPEFETAANSWVALKHPSRLYFAVIDYSSGSEIFARFKLSSAPVIFHFPPNEGDLAKPEHKKDPSKYDKYDLQRGGDSAEDILKYVETIVHTSIPLVKAPEYTKFVMAIAVLLFGAAMLKFLATSFAQYLRNPLIWAFFSLLFTLTMVSGNMWNLIRGAPYAGQNEIISPNFGSQYVLETRIIATIYGVGGLSLIALITHVPIAKGSMQRTLTYVYTAVFFIAVSLLFFVFRLKNRGYPFRFLF